MVELNPDFVESEAPADTADLKVRTTSETDGAASEPDVVQAQRPAEATASQAEGVQHVAEILQKATSARWPMYIRNVKQIIRAADAGFDERRFGFGGLMDLLRACQKEALIRMERDRRGGLRVFPGQALQRASASSELPQADVARDEAAPIPAEPEQQDFDAQPP